jgi:hypothetical protein
LSTREAVAIETPARRETSASDPFGGLDLAFVAIGAWRRLKRGEDSVGEATGPREAFSAGAERAA